MTETAEVFIWPEKPVGKAFFLEDLARRHSDTEDTEKEG